MTLSTSPLNGAARRWLAAVSVSVLTCYAVYFALFTYRVGPKDHDQFLVFHQLQYWNAALFGLAKQWTPLMCTGLSLAGEPQVPFMSLSMLLSYAFGPMLGIKLGVLLYFIAGWVGAFLYAGLWLRIPAQRILAASLFIGNGFFICRLRYGHIDLIPFLLLPVILWALHRSIDWLRQENTFDRFACFGGAMLLLAAGVSFAIDGSPVAIIHLLLWIGLYALVLSSTQRAFAPLLLLGGAVAMAIFMDAGYLWPMLEAQDDFPRRTPDTFTSVLSLIWFALLPVTGKVLPANGNGHELSVYIGPVIAYLLWRYRASLTASLPAAMRKPLLFVSVISILFGMGSLAVIHVPAWLSPFDWVRPLPGFRSMGVTGRYWGFLALPLSLLGAAALWKFAVEFQHSPKLKFMMIGALVLQLGFQSSLVFSHLDARPYQPIEYRDAFRNGAEQIEYVVTDSGKAQGEFITPTRAVLNCYNDDEFIRADGAPGKQLVRAIFSSWQEIKESLQVHASFTNWNRIELRGTSKAFATLKPEIGARRIKAEDDRLQLVLNQAYHPLWQARGCTTLQASSGNLVLECPRSQLEHGKVELTFHNALSSMAARISMRAWRAWLFAAGLLLIVVSVRRQTATRVAVPESP